jgi:hypothetical protein
MIEAKTISIMTSLKENLPQKGVPPHYHNGMQRPETRTAVPGAPGRPQHLPTPTEPSHDPVVMRIGMTGGKLKPLFSLRSHRPPPCLDLLYL